MGAVVNIEHATQDAVTNVVAKYQQIDDKLYMTLEESIALSMELARQLAALESPPQLIVGIPNGALLMAEIVAKQLKVPVHSLKIRRRGSGIKQKLGAIPGLRQIFSAIYAVPVLNLPLIALMRRFEGLQKGKTHSGFAPLNGSTVAIVDDCIETGQTVAAARDLLRQTGAGQVVVACISWSRKRDSVQQSGVTPDIFISRRVQHYPWSANSPYWEDYLAWLDERGIQLVHS